MSISSALSNALSGLNVSSRAADVVSSNIANAMTDGYGVRELDIASRVIGNSGAGARVVGVTRHEDPVLASQRRQADAALAQITTQSDFLTRMESLIGTPDQPGSLTARVADFEAALVAASNAPQSQAYLSSAVSSAESLVTQIDNISGGIQDERFQADQQIARHVERLNTTLEQLSELNVQILRGRGGTTDVSSLLDAQARLVDSIAPLVPIQTRRDAHGALQIYSLDGYALLDGRPAEFGFDAAPSINDQMRVEDGNLSGLTLNGHAVSMTGPQALLQGGSIASLFHLRDEAAVTAQDQIDTVAFDLVTRFQDPALDPTRLPGDPGLFTDSGLPAASATQRGLASRLSVNAAVVPAEGGAVWRLRDGLGAATEGPVGQSSLLHAQMEALTASLPAAGTAFLGVSRSFSGLVSEHLSLTGISRQTADTDRAHRAAHHEILRQEELAQGVDTDDELQRLLQIEQAYAANARVITAAEEMLDELMRIAG